MTRDAPFAEPVEPHVIRSPRKAATNKAATKSPAGPDSDNVVDLVRQLAGQGSHLAEQQMSLVKAEIRESATEVKMAVGAMAGAAVVGIAGLGVVLMGIAYLFADAIENLGLATLIVGVATLALAYVLYRGGASKMSSAQLAPDRTQRTLERTPDALRGDLHPEMKR